MKIPWKRTSNLFLAAIVFIIGLALFLIGFALLPLKTNGSTQKEDSPAHRLPVVLTPVKVKNFEERLVLQGTLKARDFTMASAKIPGTIEKIFVHEGDYVIAGKTRLFQIDSLTLQKEVDICKRALTLEHYKRSEKEANLERVEAELEKAELDYQRFNRLYQKRAVTADEFEQQESRYKQARAQHKDAQALVDLGLEEERQAKIRLEIAEKNLRDALVWAPMSGRVSSRLHEPGETVQPGQPIIRLDDTSVVEVSAFLPAQYYGRVIPGKTSMRMKVNGLNLPEQILSYKSPTIQPKLRTFEIKSVLDNPPEQAIPGALAEIEIILEQHSGLGIPSEAVQPRHGRTVVFTVKNDTAHMLEVKTGLENDNWLELLRDSRISENLPVVTMGQSSLDEGTPVTVIRKEEH